MKHTRMQTKLFALGAAIVLATSGLTANADIIGHTIGTADETISVTAGGPAGGTTYRVTTENGDGKNGCNLTGQTTLVVDVVSSDPSVATASPSQITFGSCDDVKTVTVLGVDDGTATISLRQVSNSTAGTFNLAPATFTVVVSGDENTAPEIQFVERDPAGPNGAGWYNEEVTFTWSCSDPDGADDIDTINSVKSVTLGEGEGQTATGKCVDLAGAEATHTVSGINIDLTAPALVASRMPEANSYGWVNESVQVTWTCTDNLSGVDTVSDPETVSAEGHDQSAAGSCTDLAGNSVSKTLTGISIDKTAPTISYSQLPSANGFGWNNTAVTATWTCADEAGGSGLVGAASMQTQLSDEGVHDVSRTCADQAGNSVTGTRTVSIDTTAPTLTLSGGPADGSIFYFGSVPDAPTCEASDLRSGLDGECVVMGYDSAVGTHTITATAIDKAGNVTTESRSYEVKAWTISGFKSPVDMGKEWNAVKGGSTVPLKFEVFAGETELTDTSVVASFKVAGTTCSADSLKADDIDFTTTGKTVLRYDATDGQFIQNWQTPKYPGKCYTVTMTTIDGSSVSANFRLK